MGVASLPKNVSIPLLYGTSVLCGIGFTMSLFIGSLAFEGLNVAKVFDERIGILIGSLASGLLGFIILKYTLKKTKSLEC
jgi:NhaA family Na+:H+ antiporter